MYLRFGNLTVKQFAERVKADFTDEEMTLLESYRTDSAGFDTPDRFHIFEDPLCVTIGSRALAATRAIWVGANDRRAFNRPVAFFPLAETPEEVGD